MLHLLPVATSSSPVTLASCQLNTLGESYLAYVDLDINFFGDYGVLAMFFTEKGVEAYGVILMKPPGEGIGVYAMAGDQNNWYYMSTLSGSKLNVTLVLDIDYRLLKVVLINSSRYFEVKTLISPRSFVVLASNATGAKSPPPVVALEGYVVYASNTSLLNVLDPLYPTVRNFTKLCGSLTPVFTSPVTSPTEETTTPTTYAPPGAQFRWTVLLVLVLLVAVIALFIRLVTGERGSPGP
ncbi:hypothetical protein TCELL_0864 [Thermogladius calderae 1633]|uniref:Uncharacterized protein n=1 Tax=Thermogladius calderae (strain DSM 22663 / VKM B-2946 / 1633) TaxID=1184251 RepID=I3TEV0_THEC1|nr:hypothetical protein TCELL_0864 [Thermogladius calderae 1633]